MQHSKNNKFKARGLVPTAVFKQFQCNTCLRGPALTGAKGFCDLLLTSCGISVPLPNIIRWSRRYSCACPNIYPSSLPSAKRDGLYQRLLPIISHHRSYIFMGTRIFLCAGAYRREVFIKCSLAPCDTRRVLWCVLFPLLLN